MNAGSVAESGISDEMPIRRLIPFWVKIAYTAFVAVLALFFLAYVPTDWALRRICPAPASF